MKVKEKVFSKLRPKRINKQNISVFNFLNLAKTYIEAFNQGILPNIEYAWVMICKNEAINTMKSCIEFVESEIKNR
jgi:hypothetical protein